jgi:hypothetical protein
MIKKLKSTKNINSENKQIVFFGRERERKNDYLDKMNKCMQQKLNFYFNFLSFNENNVLHNA